MKLSLRAMKSTLLPFVAMSALFLSSVSAKEIRPSKDFITAIKNADIDKVKDFIKKEGVNAHNESGTTPLMIAVWYSYIVRHTNVVRLLLEHPDIDVNAQDSDGDTALLRAALMGNADAAELLLEHPDIDPNARDAAFGATALMWACLHGRVEVVKLLLEHPDIDVNIKNHAGATALTISQRRASAEKARRYYETIELILEHMNKAN